MVRAVRLQRIGASPIFGILVPSPRPVDVREALRAAAKATTWARPFTSNFVARLAVCRSTVFTDR